MIASTALWYGGNPPEITAAISICSWWAIVLGAGIGILPMGGVDRRALLVLGLFTALAALTALSIDWAGDGGRAFVKTVQMTAVLGLFAVVLLCSRPASARGWLAGISGGLMFIVLLALFSRYFPGLGDDVELSANLSGVEGRLSWPLGYWNALGACAAMCAMGLGWFTAHAESRLWRSLCVAGLPAIGLAIYLTSSRGAIVALAVGLLVLVGFGPSRRKTSAGLAVGLVGAVALVLIAAPMLSLVHAESNSDAEREGLVLLAATIVIAAVVAFSWSRIEPATENLRPWWPSRLQIGIVAALVLIGLVIVNPIKQADEFLSPTPQAAIEKQEDQNSTTSHLLSAGGTGRSEYWGSALDAFESEPIRGIGAGGFETFYAMNRESGLVGKHTHSLPLQILAELGLLGALLALGILVTVAWTAWQRWQAGSLDLVTPFTTVQEREAEPTWRFIPPLLAVGAAGCVSLAIDWTAEFPAVMGPVLVSMACLVGPATRPDLPSSRPEPESLRTSLMAATAILLGGLSIWAASVGFGVATRMNASRDAVSDGRYATAADEAQEAIDLLPSSAEPRTQLTLIRELQGRNREALATVGEAIERAPDASSLYLLKARILLRLDRDERAIAAYRKAKSLDPSGLIFFGDSPTGPAAGRSGDRQREGQP